MRTRFLSAVAATGITAVMAVTPAAAQTSPNPTSTGTQAGLSPSGAATNPETNPGTVNPATPPPVTTNQSATGSSEPPPTTIASPPEADRLDPSAPSPQRLVIDPGNSATIGSNPAANSSDPNAPGQSYNAILQQDSSGNAASSNGVGSGTSGLGVTPAPSAMSPSLYPAPLTRPILTQPGFNGATSVGASINPESLSRSATRGGSMPSGLPSHSLAPGLAPVGHHSGGGHR